MHTNVKAVERQNLAVVLSAYRSIVGNRRGRIAYVGMPITSGRRLYDVLSENGVKDISELKAKRGGKALVNEVIIPNIEEGTAVARKLGWKQRKLCIAPSVFNANPWKWSQEEYMRLWYQVIAELAGTHYVMDGWEYSVGGAREILFSMLWRWHYIRPYNWTTARDAFGLHDLHDKMTAEERYTLFEELWRMKIVDASGKELPLIKALGLMVKAIADLKSRGFDCKEFLGIAWSLYQLPVLSPLSSDPPDQWNVPEHQQFRSDLFRLAGVKD